MPTLLQWRPWWSLIQRALGDPSEAHGRVDWAAAEAHFHPRPIYPYNESRRRSGSIGLGTEGSVWSARGLAHAFRSRRFAKTLHGGKPDVTDQSASSAEPPAVPLKDPVLAAFLAWLLPGLGHFYQGRYPKAALIAVCILGTFAYGLYLGGSSELGWGRVVYFRWKPGEKRLAYICQVAVGLPALPALVQANRVRNGRPPVWSGFMAPPAQGPGPFDEFGQPTVDRLHYGLHRFFELGTVYTMIAGLLNVLAIYDAWGGPAFGGDVNKDPEKDEKESSGETKKSADNRGSGVTGGNAPSRDRASDDRASDDRASGKA